MAQTIKLKRSATQGKVPSTGNLALGEIAINTYDGRVFLKKNDGSDSIQHIVVTDSVTTGSVNLNGSLTASSGILVSDDIMPDSDNTLSLGSSTVRFQLNGGTPVTVDGSGTANTITRFQSATTVEDSNIVSSDTATTFTHSNNGNTIFTVSGSNGELLTITDSNTGNLLEVNDTSGIDVFVVSAEGDVSASGAITASGITGLTTLTVDDITINGSTISDAGEFTLDVGADINLDADGGDIILRDGGTIVGTFSMNQNSGDFDIRSRVQDKDIRLRGNDGGSEITALTLDMSSAGAATFNSTVTATGATLTSLSTQSGETTALMINGSNVVGTRDLGTGAFAAAYSLPEATSTTRGGIELFSDDEQGQTANAVSDTAGRTYGIQLNSDGQAVVNVPWSANGGNATTLDSIDSSGFIRANADDEVSAHTEWQDSKEIRLGTGNDAQIYHNGTNTFFANGTGNLIIRNNTDNGNVVLQSDDGGGGIATYLYLDGTNEKVQIDKPTDISDTTQSDAKTTGAFVVDGGVGIAKTLNVGEDVVAFASSDERYKDNVTPIENPNEKLKQIGGYTFDWNDKHEVFKGQHDVGVIAQEIEKVLPEIVETRESGYKAVKYEKIVALLIESNKELLKRIEDLESKIK